MVFARLLAFEVRKGFARFGPRDLFNRLEKLVDSKKMTIEYIVLFGSPATMKSHRGKKLLKEYSKFATKVRFVYQSKENLPVHDVEKTICLLTRHKWAFTHGWDNDGNLTNATHWCYSNDYDAFFNAYERIRLHSEHFFEKKLPAKHEK